MNRDYGTAICTCGDEFEKRSYNHRYCDNCRSAIRVTNIRSDFTPTQSITFFEDENSRRAKRRITSEQWQERIENQWDD